MGRPVSIGTQGFSPLEIVGTIECVLLYETLRAECTTRRYSELDKFEQIYLKQ